MAETIERGKQQILFNYLPGRTFDFGKKSVVAKVEKVRGNVFHRLNNNLIIRKIAEQASAWHEDFRPALKDDVLHDESRFVIVEPTYVTAEMYPLVLWCSNNRCKKVFDFTRNRQLPRSKICPRCNAGRLAQLRFIKVHQCGNIEPLTPYPCRNCGSTEIALDDRGSERLSNFRWRCLSCQNTQPILGGRCGRCSWPGSNSGSQQMSIEIFRSNRTFYVHSATLINIPEKDYDGFFNLSDWYAISTAKYLRLAPLQNTRINEYAGNVGGSGNLSSAVSEAAFGTLLDRLNNGEITISEYTESIQKLRSQANPSVSDLKVQIQTESGIDSDLWDAAKYDIVDSIIPYEIGNVKEISTPDQVRKITDLGISRLTLIDDFPIIISSFGFSRLEAKPLDNNRNPLCYLNPFPADKEQGNRYPVFVDKVQADALLFQLDPLRVINWLRINGYDVQLPSGRNQESSIKGYFINLFHEVNIYEKIFHDQPLVRLTLNLIHTYSHLAIRHAALLCGLDKTSIAEYVVPKTLSVALYCNHRFGATIGALTALFEQSISEWLEQIEAERRCVYDPVCYEKGGNCHSCTHLAETSCKLFNQNLGRIYLFGGYDHELQRLIIGYFDPAVNSPQGI
ncbi:MAG: hypothetical protein QM764_08800 [Chitinophagaceae bacterium]